MSSSGAHDPERRRYPRVKAHVPLELKSAGTALMRTATNEISLCGCYIETIFTMEVGMRLEVALSVKGETIRCVGVVATKHPQVGNGIDFIDLASADQLKFSEYIKECDLQSK
jgi:hypothetical protein